MAALSGGASAQQRAGSGASLGTREFLPDSSVGAQRSHPRFQDAVCLAIGGLIGIYRRNGQLNRVMNGRGRVIGGLIALYLHFAPGPGSRDAGLTVGRFQAFCQDVGICSPGRA